MMTLRDCIKDAETRKVALGHFNISNIEMLWAIFNAAKNRNLPVIIGVSEGERNFIGLRQCVDLVKSLREQYSYPIFLNADHSYSFESVKKAIDAGFDAAIIDGTKIPDDQNIELAKKCVHYRDSIKSEILIEAELGYIGQSSVVLNALPKGVKLGRENFVHPSAAKKFVAETGIDLFAPAVGNIHGMMRLGHDPNLDIELIADIKRAVNVPLVLHGGSGTTEDDFKKSIEAGISLIHVSTELRVVYRKALQLSLQENPEEVAPYKYMKNAVKEVEKVVDLKLKVFNWL